jgi:lipid-binding SYLF domain-containing protein
LQPSAQPIHVIVAKVGLDGHDRVRDSRSRAWREPVFYAMATASVGFQAGVAASEHITMVMTEKGLNTHAAQETR